VLASGLNNPIAVRYDGTSGNLYFLEAGTDAGKYKDGALKVIHPGPSLKKTSLKISIDPSEIFKDERATVTVSGRLIDENGAGLSGRSISILRDGNFVGSVTTDPNGYYSYEWRDVYLEKGNYEITVKFEGDSTYAASNASTILTVAVRYRVEVLSEKGVAKGSGWYRPGATATVSITPTTIEKDFFTSYVFEGWLVEGKIVSTSPTYSFIVDKPATLVAGWRTEMNLVNIAMIAGVILLIIVVSVILATRRRRAPLPPPPPPPV